MLLVDPLEIRDVARDHLQMIVVAARHQMAGHDIRAARDRRFKRGEIILALLFQRDGDDDGRDQPERGQFEIGAIAPDDPAFLELADAARTGSGLQPDLLGKLDLTYPGIAEQFSQNP